MPAPASPEVVWLVAELILLYYIWVSCKWLSKRHKTNKKAAETVQTGKAPKIDVWGPENDSDKSSGATKPVSGNGIDQTTRVRAVFAVF